MVHPSMSNNKAFAKVDIDKKHEMQIIRDNGEEEEQATKDPAQSHKEQE